MLLRKEAELYGVDYERSHNSFAQGQRITELEASLENVRALLLEVNRDLEDTTKSMMMPRIDHETMSMIYLPSTIR